ncbi:hypothetical protein GC163_03315 [bacterium]|nr:hypothetical protein [bacterium]
MPKPPAITENPPNELIPAGYMAKRIAEGPIWVDAPLVTEIWSVSECIAKNFANYIPYWKHNSHWLFNSPKEIVEIAQAESLDLSELKLCYYRISPREFHEPSHQWKPFEPFADFATNVQAPTVAARLGYDIVTYSVGNSPECSPLTCNGLAGRIPTNRFGLLDTYEAAKSALESGAFDKSEPGPFRIIEVSMSPWPDVE